MTIHRQNHIKFKETTLASTSEALAEGTCSEVKLQKHEVDGK